MLCRPWGGFANRLAIQRRSALIDQGSEFISRDLDLWAYQQGVVLDFSRPGKPTDNSFIEFFNGKLRAECPNTHWFTSIDDARTKMVWIGVETTMTSGHIVLSATGRRYRC